MHCLSSCGAGLTEHGDGEARLIVVANAAEAMLKWLNNDIEIASAWHTMAYFHRWTRVAAKLCIGSKTNVGDLDSLMGTIASVPKDRKAVALLKRLSDKGKTSLRVMSDFGQMVVCSYYRFCTNSSLSIPAGVFRVA